MHTYRYSYVGISIKVYRYIGIWVYNIGIAIGKGICIYLVIERCPMSRIPGLCMCCKVQYLHCLGQQAKGLKGMKGLLGCWVVGGQGLRARLSRDRAGQSVCQSSGTRPIGGYYRGPQTQAH